MNGEVKRFDSPLRYLVPSDSRNIEFLVELDTYGGAGKCQCEDFRFRCEQLLTAGAKPSDSLRCKHLRRAREFFTDELIARLSKIEKDNGEAAKQQAAKQRTTKRSQQSDNRK